MTARRSIGSRTARLAIRSKLHDDEAIGGYLFRLSEQNGFLSPNWLMRAASLPPTFQFKVCQVKTLSDVAGENPRELELSTLWPNEGSQANVRFGSWTVPRSLVCDAGARICPFCLADRRLLPRIWQLTVNVACSTHGNLLVDQCPDCATKLGFNRQQMDRCKCGHQIGVNDTVIASPFLIDLARILDILSSKKGTFYGRAPISSLSEALRMTWFFASTSVHHNWRSTNMSKPGITVLAPMLVEGVQVLLDWPEGLYRWLAGRRAEIEGRVGLAAEFGRWFPRLRSFLRGEEFEPVLQEVRLWLARDWRQGLPKKSSFFFSERTRGDSLTATETAVRLNVSAASARSLLRTGKLKGSLRTMGSRTLHRLDIHSIDNYLDERDNSLDESQAGRRLGISASQVERIRTEGLLASITPLIDGRRDRRYLTADIAKLSQRILENSVQETENFDELIALSDVPERRQTALAALISRICAGSLKCAVLPVPAGASILAGFGICIADAFGIDASGPLLSVRESAKLLHMSTRMIPVLVAEGCIDVHADRRRKRRVCECSVLNFEARYATAKSLGANTGAAARVLSGRLRQQGIFPVIKSDKRRGISAVWLRAQVKEAIPEKKTSK